MSNFSEVGISNSPIACLPAVLFSDFFIYRVKILFYNRLELSESDMKSPDSISGQLIQTSLEGVRDRGRRLKFRLSHMLI